MKEAFLQYIWLLGNFEMKNLRTTCGQDIVLSNRGNLNHDSGPDFSNGILQLDSTKWAGSIEIHIKSSQWYEHKHQLDKAYNGVILHVVWEEDKECLREDGTKIPCLELKDRIPEKILKNHEKLSNSIQTIPCEDLIQKASYMHVSSTMERVLIERLENKFLQLHTSLESNKGNWQETFYSYLLKSFGFKTNASIFFDLAQRTPLNILGKHKDNKLQLESILYGQAGMLEFNFKDKYPNSLKKEYRFLQKKYGLIPLSMESWKFMRMRPANFPTIRISQFAHLLYQSEHLFSKILECKTIEPLLQLFDIKASSYWDNHYKFDTAVETHTVKSMGKSGVENLLINTVVPFVFAYGKSRGNNNLQDQAISILLEIKSEQNKIIKYWKELNIHSKNAFESQALIQLFNTYCKNKKCLECGIGKAILYNT